MSIDQLTSYHFEGTKGGEIEWMTPEGSGAREMEIIHEKYRAQKRIEKRFNDPNTVRNRLKAIQDALPEPRAMWTNEAGIKKLDAKYPDLGILDLWSQGSVPGYNPRNRVATPEEIANPDIAALNAELRGTPAPKRTLASKRKAAAMGAAAGLTGFAWLGTGASIAETTIRADIATTTNDPVDYLQFGLSGISNLADFAGPLGELISTPADATNVFIDEVRNPDRKPATMQTMSEGSQYSMPTDTSAPDPNEIGEKLTSVKDGVVQSAKDTWGALGSLWEKMQKGAEHINLSGYSGF